MPARLDPQLRPLVAALPRMDPNDLAMTRTVLDTRVTSRTDGPIETASVRERALAVETGGRRIPAIEFRDAGQEPAGVVVHIHGGGFVGGSAGDPFTRRWCAETAAATASVVIAIDYRLAPEHPYPAGFDDCVEVVAWVARHLAELGLPGDAPIVLHGQSAGGALAAAVALYARDERESWLTLLVLDAPVIDDRLATASMRQPVDPPIWSAGEAKASWDLYLGDAREEPTPPYAAPGRARSVSGLPPTFIAVNGVDVLRDEAIEFAVRLMESGVEVDLRVYARTCHGVALIGAETEVGRAVNDDQRTAIRSALLRTRNEEP